ncbi:Ypt/Rab-GAP domain of gyp1p superfamily protein [Trifolium repens]|nr:Ypt/Rab-GAP domain of gyp1p superfamily protein [Trifolium repens]
MYCDGGDKQWSCGKAGTVNLRKVSSFVRDIRDPCLSQSPVKVNRMLKPDIWQALSDSEGKVSGFRKALKLVVLGGIDPSIRAEVWEFLLGCYALSSTAEYRSRLRAARRELYRDLVKQCQAMHSSVGTGSLAYIVGSKVMDMRTSSKDEHKIETKLERSTSNDNNVAEATNTNHHESSDNWADQFDLVSSRASIDSTTYDSSGQQNCSSPKIGREPDGSHNMIDSSFDFPHLPVTNLFVKSGEDEKSDTEHGNNLSAQRKLRFEDDRMHSFHINNNADLVIESNSQPLTTFHPVNSEIEIASPDEDKPELPSKNPVYETHTVNQLKISDIPRPAMTSASMSQGWAASEDRVSEWLWTLHRIVVDVVRTDSHLEFYEDRRNLARMSDILAVYAWVDPATGYCQGMSDLLSPFVVIFEDDADAFWCFEMLLRRMRENFQMEGPTRVMKQLQALWHILELSDKELFAHLSKIGAESLHFAFRMLLVLFRRELSFNEALSMWEMMWAADFDESWAFDLEENCLEALDLHLPSDSANYIKEAIADSDDDSIKSGSQSSHNENDNTKAASLQPHHGNTDHPVSDVKLKLQASHAFCGLARNIWSRNGRVQTRTISSLARKGNDELATFCVAAILVLNRQKIIRETRSFDDMIKIFNDNMLEINVKRCIRTAIKLRKKYFNKATKKKNRAAEKRD